jgi:aspartyl aminopeptidase
MQAGHMEGPTGSAKIPEEPVQRDIAQDLVDYLNDSWTSFHATAVSKAMLLKAGFEQVRHAMMLGGGTV